MARVKTTHVTTALLRGNERARQGIACLRFSWLRYPRPLLALLTTVRRRRRNRPHPSMGDAITLHWSAPPGCPTEADVRAAIDVTSRVMGSMGLARGRIRDPSSPRTTMVLHVHAEFARQCGARRRESRVRRAGRGRGADRRGDPRSAARGRHTGTSDHRRGLEVRRNSTRRRCRITTGGRTAQTSRGGSPRRTPGRDRIARRFRAGAWLGVGVVMRRFRIDVAGQYWSAARAAVRRAPSAGSSCSKAGSRRAAA